MRSRVLVVSVRALVVARSRRSVLLRSGLALAAGTNENTNGLLRRYFPEGTDLSRHSRSELERVQHELNHRPERSSDTKLQPPSLINC